MNKNFKANERELVKVATYFKKQSKKLMEEGKLGEENKQVGEAVDRIHKAAHEHDAAAKAQAIRRARRRVPRKQV